MLKRIAAIIAGIAVIIGFALVGARYWTAGHAGEAAAALDKINPLVREETLYVRTVAPKSVDGYGTADYEQDAVTADGKTRPITFMGMHELKRGHYLALDAKGAYVTTYREVQVNELPAAVRAVLVQE